MNSSKKTKNKLESYHVGLLQAKAYRLLKSETNDALESFNITATDWAILGALERAEEPLLFGDLATSVGVTAPRITIVVSKLKARGWITIKVDPDDNRRKYVTLSKKGKDFVKTTEKHVQTEMKNFFADMSAKDVESYFKVLEHLTNRQKESRE